MIPNRSKMAVPSINEKKSEAHFIVAKQQNQPTLNLSPKPFLVPLYVCDRCSLKVRVLKIKGFLSFIVFRQNAKSLHTSFVSRRSFPKTEITMYL